MVEIAMWIALVLNVVGIVVSHRQTRKARRTIAEWNLKKLDLEIEMINTEIEVRVHGDDIYRSTVRDLLIMAKWRDEPEFDLFCIGPVTGRHKAREMGLFQVIIKKWSDTVPAPRGTRAGSGLGAVVMPAKRNLREGILRILRHPVREVGVCDHCHGNGCKHCENWDSME